MKVRSIAQILMFGVLLMYASALQSQTSVDSISIISIDVNPANGHLLVDVIAFDNLTPVGVSARNLRFTEMDSKDNKRELEIASIDTSSIAGLYTVALYNNLVPYQGGENKLLVEWVGNDKDKAKIYVAKTSKSFSFGSVFNQVPTLFKPSQWIVLFVAGIGLLLALFAILSLIMPIVNRLNFRKKNVVPYQRTGNVVAFDTILNEPIQEGTLVVNVCKQLIPLTVWEGLGEKCPHFPDCIHSLQCEGAGGKPINSTYFSNTEDMKKWNWLMFGSIGGFIGWMIYAFCGSGMLSIDFHVSIVRGLLNTVGMESLYPKVASDTFYGICIGLGFTIGFASLEWFQGVLKIPISVLILKTLGGAVVGGLSFFIGALTSAILPAFFSGLLSWFIFGVLLGVLLSYKSNIPVKRGILAGALAAFLSYLIFFMAFVIKWDGGLFVIEFIKLVSLLTLGGVIGYTIISVVSSLEDFEFVVMSPNERRGYSFPVSKWISKGAQIAIGKSPKAQIFIKWHDEEVLQNHANVYVKNDKVHIHAMGETLLNGILLSTDTHTSLKNQDVVQLGRHSSTQLRYKEKRSKSSTHEIDDSTRYANKGKGND